MTWSDVGTVVVGWPLTIALLLLFGFSARWAANRFINRIVKHAEEGVLPERFADFGSDPARRVQRARTMGSLLRSISGGLIISIVALMILGEFIDIAPILASAGIVGVALGFGAQSLVKDFLSGVFMIFEDQYGVGDVIDVGEATGTVEAVTLRVTRLRDVNGTVWYVPNGEIRRVGNQSQNWARTVLDVSVGYGEDLTRVRRVLEQVTHELSEDEDFQLSILEEPEIWGVEELAADAVTVRVTLKTAPLQQWRVARELRERIKSRFDVEGIEIPFPQRVVWSRSADTADDAAAGRPARDDAEAEADPGAGTADPTD
jgi:moderate conductance mechanosensitive channel